MMPGIIDYDELAAAYASSRTINPSVMRDLVEGSGIGVESSVLEVGCGTANYLAAVLEAVGCTGWGVDPSAGMLWEAGRTSSAIQTVVGHAEQLPLGDETADFVFSVDVIHHVQNIDSAYGEWWRVLRHGGRACTVTDSESVIRRRVPLSSCFPETVAVELERYPTIPALETAMLDAGFGRIVDKEVEYIHPLENLTVYEQRAYSCLQLISDDAFERGLRQLRGLIERGAAMIEARYVMLWATKV
jgi:ubiquinone/menaquinone biosynthesis C-methylase UbiE